jgi:hypothetical protein
VISETTPDLEVVWPLHRDHYLTTAWPPDAAPEEEPDMDHAGGHREEETDRPGLAFAVQALVTGAACTHQRVGTVLDSVAGRSGTVWRRPRTSHPTDRAQRRPGGSSTRARIGAVPRKNGTPPPGWTTTPTPTAEASATPRGAATGPPGQERPAPSTHPASAPVEPDPARSTPAAFSPDQVETVDRLHQRILSRSLLTR